MQILVPGLSFQTQLLYPWAGVFEATKMRSLAVYFGVLAINIVALPAMVELLVFEPAIGQAWFVVITVMVSYLGHKHFSFKGRNASKT